MSDIDDKDKESTIEKNMEEKAQDYLTDKQGNEKNLALWKVRNKTLRT